MDSMLETQHKGELREMRNFVISVFLCLFAGMAAVSAWWSATHPAIVIVQPPAAAAKDSAAR